MEKALEKCLDDAINIPGVTGVVVADQQGLCLNSKGQVTKNASGLIAELTRIAAQLEPNSREAPTIILESDTTNVYIKNVGQVTTAVFKSIKP